MEIPFAEKFLKCSIERSELIKSADRRTYPKF